MSNEIKVDSAAPVFNVPEKFLPDNRVNFEYIQWYLATQVTTHIGYIPPTTVAVSIITAKGFRLSTGTAGCVDAANFKAEIGINIAIDNAMKLAEDKLWEFLGWQLSELIGKVNEVPEEELIKLDLLSAGRK